MEMTDAGGSVVVEEARWWKGVGMEGVWRARLRRWFPSM